ncbi:hypothetical protein V1523DRAFT_401008 [Lipomyces doorenjongii]
MKFFSVISAILVLALASFVAAAVEERAYVTVTTIDTVISCAPEITQCHHTTLTSVYTPPVVTSAPIYTNSSSFTTKFPNATNSTTAPVATFTGAASSVSGSVLAVALGIVGVFALAF